MPSPSKSCFAIRSGSGSNSRSLYVRSLPESAGEPNNGGFCARVKRPRVVRSPSCRNLVLGSMCMSTSMWSSPMRCGCCVQASFRRWTCHEALQAISLMQQGQRVPLSFPLSLEAARLGKLHRLPLADSIILATASTYGATLWTQDADFKHLSNVKFFAKKRS